MSKKRKHVDFKTVKRKLGKKYRSASHTNLSFQTRCTPYSSLLCPYTTFTSFSALNRSIMSNYFTFPALEASMVCMSLCKSCPSSATLIPRSCTILTRELRSVLQLFTFRPKVSLLRRTIMSTAAILLCPTFFLKVDTTMRRLAKVRSLFRLLRPVTHPFASNT